MDRRPIGILRGPLAEPTAQVGADVLHLALPDPRNRRRQAVFILESHAVQNLIKVRRAMRAQLFEKLELHFMEQCAASERIHLLKRHYLFSRTQSMHPVEQELVGAGSEVLQRRRRISAIRETIVRQNRCAWGYETV